MHLDLAQSLSTEDFMLAFRRFVAAQRRPSKIFSDNGTNFVGAEKELVAEVRSLGENPELHAKCRAEGMDWKFQPPSAPHFGGAHESMVRSTKLALYRVLGLEGASARHPTEEVLRTLLHEVASLLNSRPLTYVS